MSPSFLLATLRALSKPPFLSCVSSSRISSSTHPSSSVVPEATSHPFIRSPHCSSSTDNRGSSCTLKVHRLSNFANICLPFYVTQRLPEQGEIPRGVEQEINVLDKTSPSQLTFRCRSLLHSRRTRITSAFLVLILFLEFYSERCRILVY